MDVSIVSGTYNRLPFLKKMVESARRSVQVDTVNGVAVYGLAFEIVLVDGGSVDGTLEWCRKQPDITLIEHGQLRGAIKAFNDGAYAARGAYVIMGNDDIEFIGDSILRAWVYMQQHPECGAGCFYQDRNRQNHPEHIKWHIEEMPVIVNGRQASLPYAQVGIFPKAIGDRVGWWGDYKVPKNDRPTYGGDNELSSHVYAAGFKVVPLVGCKIHDSEPADGLRKLNNIDGAKDPKAVHGHHPDSWAWGKRWEQRIDGKRVVGAVVRDQPTFAVNTAVKERILYLPIYEQGWEVQKEQKRGLREALARVAMVAEYDYVTRNAQAGKDAMLAELENICRTVEPTLVLCQCHGPDPIGPGEVGRLRNAAPGAKFVNWNGDYWPDNLLSDGGLALARSFDLQLTVNRSVLEEYQGRGVEADYWQIGWEPDGLCGEGRNSPSVDLVFLGNGYSKERGGFVRRLRNLAGLSLELWGNGWPDGWAVGQCVYDFKTACAAYRKARFSLGDSQWPESGFVSNRVMQALAAGGSALCHEWFRGMDELGLVDGQNCIIWRSFEELVEQLNYYLAHEEERHEIAEAGQRLALERHSFDARVEELFGMLEKTMPGADVEDWR